MKDQTYGIIKISRVVKVVITKTKVTKNNNLMESDQLLLFSSAIEAYKVIIRFDPQVVLYNK